jgi:predicted enzyme related to lactoylglutathione lyase
LTRFSGTTDRTVSPGPVRVGHDDLDRGRSRGAENMGAVTFFEISGPDTGRLRAFYQDALGLPVGESDGSPYLSIAPSDGAIPGGLFDGAGLFGEPGLHYVIPYIEVDDVDAAVEQAVAAGATLALSARQHGPTRSAHLLDPCGSRFGVYTNLPDPQG